MVDGEHDLLRAVLGVHDGAPVVDTEELMHHRLVRPLRQERRDGIVAAVEHEEERRHVRAAEVEERRVGVVHARDELVGELAGERAHALVAHDGFLFEAEEEGEQRTGVVLEGVGVPLHEVRAPEAVGRHVVLQREVRRRHGHVVGEELLDGLDELVLIGLGQGLDVVLRDDVAEVEPVGAVFGREQLLAQRVYRRRARAHVHEALQVVHPLAWAVAEFVGQVHLVLEEGGLRERRGHGGRRVVVEEQHLHAAHLLDHALDVRRDGLAHIHRGGESNSTATQVEGRLDRHATFERSADLAGVVEVADADGDGPCAGDEEVACDADDQEGDDEAEPVSPRAVVVVLVAPDVEPAGEEEEGAPEHGGHDAEERVEEGDELGEHVGGYPGQEVDGDPHGPQDPLVLEVPPP